MIGRRCDDPRLLAGGLLLGLSAAVVLPCDSRADWAEDHGIYRTLDGKKYSSSSIFAIRQPNIFYHNVGLLELFVCNIGRVGNGQLNLDSFSAGWRGGEYLYIGAMWIGAIASDNLAYCTTGGYDFELLPSQDPVDTMYPAYEGTARGNRPGFSARPDDDGDGTMDEEFLNGKDDDHDGSVDEDFAAVSQQMFSCEYWDYGQEAQNFNPEHRPLNLRVRQSSYQWATANSNEFVGFDFTIINDGFETLRRVYLGFFVDSDCGPKDHASYWTDDGGFYVTKDTTFTDPTIQTNCNDPSTGELVSCAEQKLHMDIMSMFDRPDDGVFAKGGDVDGVFGGMFLGHTIDPFGVEAPSRVQMHTARFFSGSNPYPLGDPRNDVERYDLLQSGEHASRETTAPDDYRYVFSAGPFVTLDPGEELHLQAAFVAGLGKAGMITNAIRAQQIFNGAWRDVDGNSATGNDGKETCLHISEAGAQLFWTDPCDSISPETRSIKDLACLPVNYVDNDCDCCTPLLRTSSEHGLESLVHWVGTVAPAPPFTNLDPPQRPQVQVEIASRGDRRVRLAWDNQSELSVDPGTQELNFTGYRIWRVEGWSREIGSTGPAPEEWQLIADLSSEPPDGLGTESPDYYKRFQKDVDSLYLVPTGASGDDAFKWYYPVGRYEFVDSLGLKNGMVYFYDVTAYSVVPSEAGDLQLESRPTAVESQGIVPRWNASEAGDMARIGVVPDPYIRDQNPRGWDLTPSDADPTGTKIAFVNLPAEECDINIYSMSGDLVRTLHHDGRSGDGTAFWNLVSRNGQDIVSGVYLFSAECGKKTKVGRFTILR